MSQPDWRQLSDNAAMGESIITTTAKANILRLADGTIAKDFFDHTKVWGEWNALRRLSDLFVDTDLNGWTYTVVRPLELHVEKGRITMTEAPGTPIMDSLGRDPSLAWHAGVWLGILHRADTDKSGLVPCFSGYSRSHVYVDHHTRTVSALDPGPRMGTKLPPEQDLLEFCRSAVVGLGLRPRAWARAVRAVLDGYDQTATHAWSRESLKKSARATATRQRNFTAGTSRVRTAVDFGLVYGLSLVCRWYLRDRFEHA